MVHFFHRLSQAISVMLALSIGWGLIEKFNLFGVVSKSPVWFLVILLWGMFIVANYFSKSEMPIAIGLTVAAGQYNDIHRLVGLLVGILTVALAAYGYLSGWQS